MSDPNKRICIAVAAHKPYPMPSDSIYMPMHVGKALHPDVDLGEEFVPDNTGDNISDKNASYSELTALYWMWKNCDADYKGLVHYRRHFAKTCHGHCGAKNDRISLVADDVTIRPLLSQRDIILPRYRNYLIENIYSHYAHTIVDGEMQLRATRKIIKSVCPDYLPAFDSVMQSTKAHMFNMMIMSRDKYDGYCAWLFPILAKLNAEVSDRNYDSFNARYPGRISEILLDVWLKTNHYDYEELSVLDIEPVNWLKKGGSFLLAKVVNRKYDKSF